MRQTHSIAFPAASRILDEYQTPDLADAWQIHLPIDASADPEELARHMFATSPRWITVLMLVRDVMVSGLGLKTALGLRSNRGEAVERVGIFRIYARHADEIILGEDDRHLDFRLSVLRTAGTATQQDSVTVATTVECHNLTGRLYLWFIAPFHRAVVRSTLRNAARKGWPTA